MFIGLPWWFRRVKNLPAMWETWVWSLGREDPLEKGMATHSSILAWRIPWKEEPGGHKESDVAKQLSLHFTSLLMFMAGFPGGSVVKNPPADVRDADAFRGSGRSPGEGSGNPLQYACLGSPWDRGAWWATVLWVTKESDMTQWLNSKNVHGSTI